MPLGKVRQLLTIQLYMDDVEGAGIAAMEEFNTVEIDLLFERVMVKLTKTIFLQPP